jgi:adenylate kinase family enzyme
MNEHDDARPDALLVLGPTGSGKTPLGDELERNGLGGRACVHFDFGLELRSVVAGDPSGLLEPADLAFLRRVLEEGALLEDEHFRIAQTVLTRFLGERRGANGPNAPLVILNGLPRHVGQARDVAPILAVNTVVHLACTADVVLERIRTDIGRDRAGRTDDDRDAVRRKLALFERWTKPLIKHYRFRRARVVDLRVCADTRPADLRAALEAASAAGIP